MVKLILFDMDGVLTDTEPLHYDCWKQAFLEHGIDLDYETYKPCIGSTREFLCNLILNAYGIDFRKDPSVRDRMSELKAQYISQNGLPRIDGVEEVVRTLYERGYMLAVVSSSPLESIRFNMETLGLSQYFTLLFSCEQVPRPKPAPDGFLAAAGKLQIPPEECIVIEDSYNGTRSAKAAGMTCLGFRNPGSGDQDLSAADRIFHSLRELLTLIS